MVDSGTTMFYADNDIHETILLHFDEFCDANENNCAGIKRDVYNCFVPEDAELLKEESAFAEWTSTFPIFEFEMDNNYIYNWRPEMYLT